MPEQTIKPKQLRKGIAIEFLQMVATGKIREAYDKYVSPSFIHHNVYFQGDRNSLLTAMEENHEKFPNKVLEVKRALQDEDFVVVHSHVTLEPGERGMALVHIFRFEGEMIVELWDLGQPVPESSPNEYGMF